MCFVGDTAKDCFHEGDEESCRGDVGDPWHDPSS